MNEKPSFLVRIPACGRFGAIHEVSAEGCLGAQEAAGSWAWKVHLVIRIDRVGLESHLAAMLARPLSAPLRFERRMDLTDQATRTWLNVVPLLLENNRSAEVESLLFSGLLLAQPNNYSASIGRSGADSSARAVRAAMEFLEARAADPITTDDLARAVGVGTRTIQQNFKRHTGMSPMSYLRSVRMRHVAEELLAADPTRTTVSKVAARWGFLQPGRFAAEYRRRFGEPPSATLRR